MVHPDSLERDRAAQSASEQVTELSLWGGASASQVSITDGLSLDYDSRKPEFRWNLCSCYPGEKTPEIRNTFLSKSSKVAREASTKISIGCFLTGTSWPLSPAPSIVKQEQPQRGCELECCNSLGT